MSLIKLIIYIYFSLYFLKINNYKKYSNRLKKKIKYDFFIFRKQ